MNLPQALQNVIKSTDNQDNIDPEVFCTDFDLSGYDCNWTKCNEAVKAYWLTRHICTDTWVGEQAIYLHDELVAFTSQAARKSGYNIYYLNDDCAQKMRDFLVSIMAEDAKRYNVLSQGDLDTEFPAVFSCDYASQILDTEGFHDGKPVVVTGKTSQNFDALLRIRYTESGETAHISATEYQMPVRVRDSAQFDQ